MKKRPELKSQRPYKVSTMSIGDLMKSKMASGNPQVRANSKKFLKMVNKKG